VRAMRVEGEMVLSSKWSWNQTANPHACIPLGASLICTLYSVSHMHCTLIKGSAQRSMQVLTQATCSCPALGTVHPALHKAIAPEIKRPMTCTPVMPESSSLLKQLQMATCLCRSWQGSTWGMIAFQLSSIQAQPSQLTQQLRS